MNGFRLSATTWKWLICLFVAIAFMLQLRDARNAFPSLLRTHEHGTLGAALNDHLGRYPENYGSNVLRILSIASDSPLLAYGAQVGDQLRYDRTEDRWRRFQIDETIGLTLMQRGTMRHISVRAVATPVPFAEKGDYVARFILAVPALLFSFLVGMKQGGGRSHRALALMFCALSLIFYVTTNYSPAGPVFYTCKLLQLASYALLWHWCVQFTLYYQDYPVSRLRARLHRLAAVHRMLAYATSVCAIVYGLGYETPALLPLTGATVAGGLAISIASLIDGWRQSTGELSQRHCWLLLSFALGSIPPMLAWIPALDAGYDGLRWTMVMMFIGQFAMFIGLAYAVLRHRVFNFDFAFNRMVVYSVISILLLSTCGVLELLSSSLLHGGGHAEAPASTWVIDGLLALAIYIGFHNLHDRVEHWVEHIFFREWHENERKLQQYIRQAAQIMSIDALLESCCNAIDRFTGQAGCAIYLRQTDGSYKLAIDSTLEQAPPVLQTDSTIAVALRSEMTVLRMDDLATDLSSELSVPMSHRSTLHGFMLIGGKRSGESYRPDETTILSFAAQQIGLDLHALRVELLEQEVRGLSHHVEQQDLELLLMAGRRKASRALTSAEV